jgi:phthalate 4,5-dioxygenase oxygenase subunit
MGPALNRTGEHLMPSDVAIVVGRKLMLKALQDIEEGKDPPNVIRESRLNHFPDVVTTSGFISSSTNWKEQYNNLAEEIDGQRLTPLATASNDKILANE